MLTVPVSELQRLLSQRTYVPPHTHTHTHQPLRHTHSTHADMPHTPLAKENSFFVDSIARVPERQRASPFKVPDKIGVAAEQRGNSRSGR